LPWIAHIDIYICLTAKINLLEKKKDDVTKKAKVDELDDVTKAKVDKLKKRRDELYIPESINALSRAEGLKISQDFHVDSPILYCILYQYITISIFFQGHIISYVIINTKK